MHGLFDFLGEVDLVKSIDLVSEIVCCYVGLYDIDAAVRVAGYSETTLRNIMKKVDVKAKTKADVTLRLGGVDKLRKLLMDFSDEFQGYEMTLEVIKEMEEQKPQDLKVRLNPLTQAEQDIYMYAGSELKPTEEKLQELLPRRSQLISSMISTGELSPDSRGGLCTPPFVMRDSFTAYHSMINKCHFALNSNPAELSGTNFTADYWLYDTDYLEACRLFGEVIRFLSKAKLRVVEDQKNNSLNESEGNYCTLGYFFIQTGLNTEERSD